MNTFAIVILTGALLSAPVAVNAAQTEAAAPTKAAAPTAAAKTAQIINLNTATAEQIATLSRDRS